MNSAIHGRSVFGPASVPLRVRTPVLLSPLVIASCLIGCTGLSPGTVDISTKAGSLHVTSFDTNMISETIIRERRP